MRLHITLVTTPEAQLSREWTTLVDDIERYFNNDDEVRLVSIGSIGQYGRGAGTTNNNMVAISYYSDHKYDLLATHLINSGFSVL